LKRTIVHFLPYLTDLLRSVGFPLSFLPSSNPHARSKLSRLLLITRSSERGQLVDAVNERECRGPKKRNVAWNIPYKGVGPPQPPLSAPAGPMCDDVAPTSLDKGRGW
jgi:hypothetical protein